MELGLVEQSVGSYKTLKNLIMHIPWLFFPFFPSQVQEHPTDVLWWYRKGTWSDLQSEPRCYGRIRVCYKVSTGPVLYSVSFLPFILEKGLDIQPRPALNSVLLCICLLIEHTHLPWPVPWLLFACSEQSACELASLFWPVSCSLSIGIKLQQQRKLDPWHSQLLAEISAHHRHVNLEALGSPGWAASMA